jgi:hypothetical protein
MTGNFNYRERVAFPSNRKLIVNERGGLATVRPLAVRATCSTRADQAYLRLEIT